MTEAPKAWQELPAEVRKSQIIHQLTLMELENADPEFYYKYTVIMGLVTDQAEKMRVDIQMINKVGELRQAGRIVPVASIQESATKMVDLDSEAMLQAFHDYSNAIKDRPKNVIENPLHHKLLATQSRISDTGDYRPQITDPVIQARLDRLSDVIIHKPKRSS